jgi:hypothetical protein
MDSLVQIILMSDGTNLSNIAWNMNEWPVYMTIANVSWEIRQMPSTHSLILVDFQPIPIKDYNVPQMRLND